MTDELSTATNRLEFGSGIESERLPAIHRSLTSPNRLSRIDEQATFEIIDEGSSRADLATRRELKFALPRADVQKLSTLLACNGRRQVFNHPASTVYSVYFDDARLSSCHANLHGLGRRIKMRLRWYDAPRPNHDFFYEIKWRDNRVTGKHRLHVRSAVRLADLPYRAIVSKLIAVLPQHCQAAVHQYCEPTVLVRYQREHFVSAAGVLRATIDYNITYFDQTAKQLISTSFGMPHEGQVVLEGKTAVGQEHQLRSLLHPFGARLTRSSKYVDGCLKLGLAYA